MLGILRFSHNRLAFSSWSGYARVRQGVELLGRTGALKDQALNNTLTSQLGFVRSQIIGLMGGAGGLLNASSNMLAGEIVNDLYVGAWGMMCNNDM